jgi:hypothetical protein
MALMQIDAQHLRRSDAKTPAECGAGLNFSGHEHRMHLRKYHIVCYGCVLTARIFDYIKMPVLSCH